MHFFGITSLSQLEYENTWPLNPWQKKKSKRLKKPMDYICSFCTTYNYYVQKGKKITFTNKIGTDLE